MSRPAASSTELVERHRAEILRYLVRMLGDPEEAQDACQEVFLRAHRAFGRLRADSNPPSEELTFRDPDNILVQLQDVSYCGGEGKLGERCR